MQVQISFSKPFLLLALVTLMYQGGCQSPMPIPVPIKIEAIQGLWYVTLIYDSEFNNSDANSITCFTVEFNVTGKLIQMNETIYYNEEPDLIISYYTYSDNPSIWTNMEASEEVLEWIAIYPIVYSSGMIGAANTQYAEILSRSPSLPGNITANLMNLLVLENYNLDSDDTYFIGNSCL